MKETLPNDETEVMPSLCGLLAKSAENQQTILSTLGSLAAILNDSVPLLEKICDGLLAAKNAELVRADLDARYEFSQFLEADVKLNVQDFFLVSDNNNNGSGRYNSSTDIPGERKC
jgi:hypothetical protein